MTERLSDEELNETLPNLPGWSRAGDAITKTYLFSDFRAAMWFVNIVAGVADAMDHHPEWCNVYNRVTVTLRTHDAGGVTDKDIALAQAMDGAAG